jgi:hypothetical protein
MNWETGAEVGCSPRRIRPSADLISLFLRYWFQRNHEPTHRRRAGAGRYPVETRSLPRSLAPTLVILPSMSLIPSAPFKADLAPDSERFIAHCKWLLSQNCGLAVFGTNSEANSLSMEERAMLLDEVVAASGKLEVRIKI